MRYTLKTIPTNLLTAAVLSKLTEWENESKVHLDTFLDGDLIMDEAVTLKHGIQELSIRREPYVRLSQFAAGKVPSSKQGFDALMADAKASRDMAGADLREATNAVKVATEMDAAVTKAYIAYLK